MGIFGAMFRGTWGLAKEVGGGVLRNSAGMQIGVGAAIGGMYGYGNSKDYWGAEGKMGAIGGGVLTGALAGAGVFGLRRLGPGAVRSIGSAVGSYARGVGVRGTARGIWGTAKVAGRTAYGVAGTTARFVTRHPGVALLGAGGLAATYAFGGSAVDAIAPAYESPAMPGAYADETAMESNIRLRQEMNAGAIMQQGVAPMGTVGSMRGMMLQQSTQGLVQGLHAGRHR